MLPADGSSPSMLSAAVSLTPSSRRCRPLGVSSLRFHPPTRPFPTERLPRAGSPPFQRYYERATTPDSPLLPLRSSLRLRFSGRPSLFAHTGGTATTPVPGILVSRSALIPAYFPEDCRISQVPMRPLRPSRSSRDRLTPTPCSQTPAERRRLTLTALPSRPRTLEHQGPRRCVNFGAQSHGSAHAVYASCRPHGATMQDSLAAGG
jgi:hypothetical protein